MKRLTLAAFLVLALSAPALADVTVKATASGKGAADLFAPPAGYKIKEQK